MQTQPEEKTPELEIWLCPVHRSLDEHRKLMPLDKCVACLRNERDGMRVSRNELLEALKLALPYVNAIPPSSDDIDNSEIAAVSSKLRSVIAEAEASR